MIALLRRLSSELRLLAVYILTVHIHLVFTNQGNFSCTGSSIDIFLSLLFCLIKLIITLGWMKSDVDQLQQCTHTDTHICLRLTTVPASESTTLYEQTSVDSVANHKIQNNERFVRRVLRFFLLVKGMLCLITV